MVAAHRAAMATLVARWAPDRHAEARAMLDHLARALIAEIPAAPKQAGPAKPAAT